MSIPSPFGLALLAVLFCMPALADEGHSHDAAPTAPSGPALPRFSASSERFEVVGVIDGKQLTLYLDHHDSNAPVEGATVEVDLGGAKLALEEHEPGEFEGALAQPLAPGETPVRVSIKTQAQSDTLSTDVDLHAEEAHAEAPASHPGRRLIAWGAGALALGLLLAWALRRSMARRVAGGAA